MTRAPGLVPFGTCLLAFLPVVHAQETTGVIVASVVAAVLLISLVLGIALFCYFRRDRRERPEPRPQKKRIYMENGFHPPHYEKRYPHKSNGYVKPQPIAPVFMEPLPPPPPRPVPIAVPPPHRQPYATYHGPPAEMRNYARIQNGATSGPAPIVIPFGTVAVRPDPRPVVHKSRRKRESDTSETRRRSPKHRSPERRKPQEFVIEQSYDGIPVIRPVIYVDDDDSSAKKHRSKSREGRYKKRSTEPSPAGPRITEVRQESSSNLQETTVTVEPQPYTRPKSVTPQPSHGMRSTDRSRASSVTEAVRAIKQSVMGHADDSDSTDSSRAPSFTWAHDEPKAPQPRAGDVMFFPAGTHVDDQRHTEPEPEVHKPQPAQDDPYVYTKVIKTSVKENQRRRSSDSPVQAENPAPTKFANEGYEVPVSRNTGTRDEEISYETEHGRAANRNTNIGASMSDRLQDLVETGDKTRFTHYNIGAMNFGDEEEEIDPDQIRHRRPNTPPPEPEADHIYARAIKRPESPPNDIPLITPRESREVPPLDLDSAVASPRDQSFSYRPATPPKDFPITPKSSFVSPRPRTPPTDFPMTPKEETISLIPDTSDLNRSLAVDPSTGDPGSFQARQRLIEAHLMKNASSSNVPAPKPKETTTTATPPYKTTPAPPPAPVIEITPGVIPPAPPPPPLPK